MVLASRPILLRTLLKCILSIGFGFSATANRAFNSFCPSCASCETTEVDVDDLEDESDLFGSESREELADEDVEETGDGGPELGEMEIKNG